MDRGLRQMTPVHNTTSCFLISHKFAFHLCLDSPVFFSLQIFQKIFYVLFSPFVCLLLQCRTRWLRVCICSLAGIAGSNTASSMTSLSVSVSLYCGCCVLSGEVSVWGWSPVRRSLTECDVSECCREASIVNRHWQTRGCCAKRKKKPKTVFATKCQMCEDLDLALINSAVGWVYNAWDFCFLCCSKSNFNRVACDVKIYLRQDGHNIWSIQGDKQCPSQSTYRHSSKGFEAKHLKPIPWH